MCCPGLCFVDNIRRNIDQGQRTGAVFIDLRTAFDTVNYDMPLNKLSSLGIENRQLDWFRNDRHKRTQVVEFLSVPSSPEAVAVSFSTVNPGTAAIFSSTELSAAGFD